MVAKPVMVAAMGIDLYQYQQQAIDSLRPGSILCGGVGSGKSRTAIAYYFLRICKARAKINGIGDFGNMKHPKDLYIITTAKKRDSLEWERECAPFMISKERDASLNGVKLVVDSWNNISKYKKVENAFFIFDEQRLIGSGTWVKSFLKIVKNNGWILLSATPGDTWLDYIPIFIANGFYKNRTEFLRDHVIFSRFTKYPKVERYIQQGKLTKLKNLLLVSMSYARQTIHHNVTVATSYDKNKFAKAMKDRWDVYKNKPIKNAAELCYILRKIVNEDPSRLEKIKECLLEHSKIIIFYNFDYELEILRKFCKKYKISFGEWNGHKHEVIPVSDKWLYLVQYTAGAEGWNCIETNAIIFYSQNYSYKIVVQASGRIDRLNTPYKDLYYYHLRTDSPIDVAISQALKTKKLFNANNFIGDLPSRKKHTL